MIAKSFIPLLLCLTVVAEAGNLVRNSDFSAPGIVTKPSPPLTQPDHRIPAWELNGFWHADPDELAPLTGSTVIKADAKTSTGSLRQALYLKAGTTYTLSAWVKAKDLRQTDEAIRERGTRIRVSDWKGTQNIFLGASKDFTSEWQRYSTTFTAPADYVVAGVLQPCFLTLYMPKDESGTIWITGVQLEEGDELTDFDPVSLTDIRDLETRITAQEKRIKEAVDAIERFEGDRREEIAAQIKEVHRTLETISARLTKAQKLSLDEWRALEKESESTLLRAHEATVPYVWWEQPWEDLGPRVLPPGKGAPQRATKVTLAINDYGAALLPITTLTQDAIAVEVRIGDDAAPLSTLSAFSGPIRAAEVLRVSNEGSVSLHSRVQAHGSYPYFLNPLGEGNTLVLPGQQTAQLWLDINTRGMKAGTYRYPILLKGLNTPFEWKGEITLDVLPVELPDRVPATVIAFSSMPFFMPPLNPHNRDQNLTHLTEENRMKIAGPWLRAWQEMGFNRLMVPNQFLTVKFTDEGDLAEPVDYARLDALREMYGSIDADFFGAYNYAAYHVYSDWRKASSVGDLERKRMKSVFTSLIEHFRKEEIQPESFPLCMFDEPYGVKLDIARAGAEELKKIAPDWPILSTAIGTERHHVDPMVPFVDIFVVRQRMGRMDMEPRTIAYLKRQGKEVWGYCCSGSFDYMHPYRYFRLLPWQAWQNELTGYGAYMSLSPQKFEEIGPRANLYSPLFFGRTGPLPGKGAKGLQRGGRDWCLFVQARERAQQLRKDGDEKKADELQRLLTTSVAAVLKNENDVSLADQSREALLRALAK